MVAVVCCPTKCTLRQIARADNHTANGICTICKSFLNEYSFKRIVNCIKNICTFVNYFISNTIDKLKQSLSFNIIPQRFS